MRDGLQEVTLTRDPSADELQALADADDGSGARLQAAINAARAAEG